MACFVHGIGVISAQNILLADSLLESPVDYSGERLSCVEPDYSRYFDVRQLRRMSRIIRIGMVAGLDALHEAGVKVPDAIITGTGYGCLEDTGLFLTKMIENHEHALNPTPFIQSTHNTIGSQLALLLQCLGYNQTYTQRALSFENALTDALMASGEDPTQRLLTGAVDEITDVSHDILRRFRIFRGNNASSLSLFRSNGRGTLNGEGAAYFLLSGTPKHNAVELKGVQSFYRPSGDDLNHGLQSLLASAGRAADEIDIVITGKSGDQASDRGIGQFVSKHFPQATSGVFKHLTGEFSTASALAMAIACRMIEGRRIPDIILERGTPGAPRHVLIYNRYFQHYHSLILLSAS